jgi:cobalamin biosynthesis Mg chelatase CobN|tara:strand:- start:1467 stop:2306 length:840 start_codon:yes stop_codon:yes gene_type:complete
MSEAIGTEGHNAPPTEAEIVHGNLRTDYETLLTRVAELVAAGDRIPEIDAYPAGEETAKSVSDYIAMLNTGMADAKAARVAEKDIHRQRGAAVDAFFGADNNPALGTIRGRLLQVKIAASKRLGIWQDAQEAAERKAREAAEELARKEAAEAQAKLDALAEKERLGALEEQQALDDAIVKQAAVLPAQMAAQAPPVDLSRVRGEQGAVASRHSRWTAEVNRGSVSPATFDVLLPHISQDALDKAARSWLKTIDTKNPAARNALMGVHVYEVKSTHVTRS